MSFLPREKHVSYVITLHGPNPSVSLRDAERGKKPAPRHEGKDMGKTWAQVANSGSELLAGAGTGIVPRTKATRKPHPGGIGEPSAGAGERAAPAVLGALEASWAA